MSVRRCPEGHPMTVRERFVFDHDLGDNERERTLLAAFEGMGFELGAQVTLWYCAACDAGTYDFRYPDDDARG